MKQGWEEKTLGQLCVFTQGIQRDVKLQSETQDENQVRFLRIVDYTQGNEPPRYIDSPGDKYILNAQDVALVRYGASTGFVCRGLEGALANNLFRVIPKSSEKLTIDFLFVYLKSPIFQNVIKVAMNGAAMPAISFGLIEEIPFHLPPLLEQERIVSILDKALSAIEQAKQNAAKNLKNAKELFDSYLNKIFTNKGDDWEIKKLGEVCEFKSGTTISPLLEHDIGDIIYTKIADMNLPTNEVEINTSSRFVSSDEIKLNQIIPNGAVIFPKRGGAIATNKKRQIIKPTIVDLNTMAIIPSKQINNDYFFHWFQLFDLNAISNGANIPQINNYSFDNVYIPYPMSLIEQQAIVKKIDALSVKIKQLEVIYRQKLTELEDLKKSILQKAFNGELSI